jgi:hypothetical protein
LTKKKTVKIIKAEETDPEDFETDVDYMDE